MYRKVWFWTVQHDTIKGAEHCWGGGGQRERAQFLFVWTTSATRKSTGSNFKLKLWKYLWKHLWAVITQLVGHLLLFSCGIGERQRLQDPNWLPFHVALSRGVYVCLFLCLSFLVFFLFFLFCFLFLFSWRINETGNCLKWASFIFLLFTLMFCVSSLASSTAGCIYTVYT